MLAPTNANILKFALKPTFEWLIATALDGGVMTYGEIKRKLEDEHGFSTIFPTRTGYIVGSLILKIHEKVPEAPLINVLAVSRTDRQPSKGARTFLADRFDQPLLRNEDAKEKYPDLWKATVGLAASEVYQLGSENWQSIYRKVFGAPPTAARIEQQRHKRKLGTENDGIPTGRKTGPGGEGPLHRKLRLWVMSNPEAIDPTFAGAKSETELDLDSGDRVDVAYTCIDRIVLLEVKSRKSNEIDLRRGVFQCIKYRAVRTAMDVRDSPLVEVYLVTEEIPPEDITALLRLHDIKHFLAPRQRD